MRAVADRSHYAFEAYTGRAHALRPGPFEGADALGPDRVGQDVEAVELDERRRMVDVGHAQAAALDARRRGRPLSRAGPLAPRPALARKLPAQEVREAVLLGRPGVLEAPVGEVVSLPPVVGRDRESVVDEEVGGDAAAGEHAAADEGAAQPHPAVVLIE